MDPEYTIIVVNTIPSSPIQCYMCYANVDEDNPLAWGMLTGTGKTVEGAVQDWRRRIALWEEMYPGFSNWPTPIATIPEQAIHSFTWRAQSCGA